MAQLITKTKILLMDRDNALVTNMVKTLETIGYTIFSADNRNHALDIVLNERPELAIFETSDDESCCLDIAIELYQSHNVPFMVISESAAIDGINKAVRSGALSYLLKPIHPGQVQPVIESALHRARDIRRLQDTEENLSTAIQSSRVISAATGILMERFRLTNKMAFELLRSEARSNQKKVLDVANEILVAAETVNQFNLINNTPKK